MAPNLNSFKFAISNLVNAEQIRSEILERKRVDQNDIAAGDVSVKVGSADELKKYKELLDDGVISQEEFEKKKHQILGT